MSSPSGTPENPFNGDDPAQNDATPPAGGSSLPSYSAYTDAASEDQYSAAPQMPMSGMYPGAGRRFGAYLIDGIIIGIIGAILMVIFAGDDISTYVEDYNDWVDAGSHGTAPTLDGGGILIASLISLVIWYIYRIGMEVTRGQTVGKMALGIKVVDTDGARLTAGASFKRNSWFIAVFLLANFVGIIGMLVSFVLLAVLGVLIARSQFKQHSFDQWAKAYVVNAR